MPTPPVQPRNFYSEVQAADLLGMHRATLRLHRTTDKLADNVWAPSPLGASSPIRYNREVIDAIVAGGDDAPELYKPRAVNPVPA